MTQTTPPPMDPAALDDLHAVLDATETVLAAIRQDQMSLPTPCPGFEVSELVDHVLGWSHGYAERLVGGASAQEAASRAGDGAAQEFHACAAEILAGYRARTPGSEQLPAAVVLMDLIAHGWDLAVATGQPVRFPDSAASRALATGQQMLTPDNRGDMFGPALPPPSDATDVERLVAFLGRDPRWSPPTR